MVDYFGNRYWPERYWAARYFQGGEQPAGSMQAALSGTATVTATVGTAETAASSSGGSGHYRFPRRAKPDWPQAYPLPVVALARARIKGGSTIAADFSAAAQAQAAIAGSSGFAARGGTIDIYAHEAEFWLMAA